MTYEDSRTRYGGGLVKEQRKAEHGAAWASTRVAEQNTDRLSYRTEGTVANILDLTDL